MAALVSDLRHMIINWNKNQTQLFWMRMRSCTGYTCTSGIWVMFIVLQPRSMINLCSVLSFKGDNVLNTTCLDRLTCRAWKRYLYPLVFGGISHFTAKVYSRLVWLALYPHVLLGSNVHSIWCTIVLLSKRLLYVQRQLSSFSMHFQRRRPLKMRRKPVWSVKHHMCKFEHRKCEPVGVLGVPPPPIVLEPMHQMVHSCTFWGKIIH